MRQKISLEYNFWCCKLLSRLLDYCRFDKRITASAEEKFKRDGIDLKTGSMVVKLSDKEISTKDRATGQISSIPYGMVVWSTGIGTRPVIMDFMKQIGQVSFFKPDYHMPNFTSYFFLISFPSEIMIIYLVDTGQ